MWREILAIILIVMWVYSFFETNGKFVHHMIDDDTGCQYMASWYGMPGPVRLDEEGKPMGCTNLENWQNRPIKE